ncbi:MAG: NAD(P)-dependent oxidoreductase [archaeon]
MKKIIITGSKGLIGSILTKNLKHYQITSIDLPKHDIKDYKKLLKLFPNHQTIIHLAWDTKTDNVNTKRINPDNSLMFWNVYKAALESKIKRVIMASSVHANAFYENYHKKKKMSPYSIPIPDSPYGAHKVFMESMGKFYAKKGLEVICIRFGGVIPNNKPNNKNPAERAVWLSHDDCISLTKRCIEAKEVPNKFTIIHGISNNKKRIHSLSNPFNWKPKDK